MDQLAETTSGCFADLLTVFQMVLQMVSKIETANQVFFWGVSIDPTAPYKMF